jgi:hypothetical protein
MTELIVNIPSDKNPIDDKEKLILDTYFPSIRDHETKNKIFIFKDAIIGSIIFGFLSFEFVDNFIYKIFPSSSVNKFYLVGLKMIIFCLFFFIITNYYLFKK